LASVFWKAPVRLLEQIDALLKDHTRKERTMKTMYQANRGATLEDIASEALWVLAQLRSAVRCGRGTCKQFAASQGLIAALPLSTPDFAWTDLRIRNARRYFAGGELGAAAYELGLAMRRLHRSL
jgi:hypothetical protein